MSSVCIIAEKSQKISRLHTGLAQKGFHCSLITSGDEAIKHIVKQAPDIVLLEIKSATSQSEIRELSQKINQKGHLPIIVLTSAGTLESIDGHSAIDDFLTSPYDIAELILRMKRLLHQTDNRDNEELIRHGDLTLDLAKCEVTVGNRVIMLTFREYELLKFLASNRSRVFTRETLLNKVWGYNYYGGDRTVDVHIRRLRSKIEDTKHTFIETVRNIGYRFK